MSAVTYGRLSAVALLEIKGAYPHLGGTIARFIRFNNPDGKWSGDRCGCTDDRCIGHHHETWEDCGCLPVVLDRWRVGELEPVVWVLDVIAADGAIVTTDPVGSETEAVSHVGGWERATMDYWWGPAPYTATVRRVERLHRDTASRNTSPCLAGSF